MIATLSNVSKRFGAAEAVKNVSLTLRPSERTALLGPNGAGKTTLLGMLLGLITPSAGKVTLFGQSPRSPLALARVGAMLQRSGVPALLSVGELVRLFSRYYPSPMPAGELLDLAGLAGLETRRYGKLSGGEQQRVHLALALCGNPQLLVLDEPTTGLDVALQVAFWQVIERLSARGTAVLFSTHRLDEAERYGERIVVLHQGRLVADSPKAQLTAEVGRKRVRLRTKLTPEAVRALPAVQAVRATSGRLEVLTTRPEPLIAELTALDPALGELEVTGSEALEAAYLALTEG